MPLPAVTKIDAQVTSETTQADLNFSFQMIIECDVLWTSRDKDSFEYYASCQQLFESADV
jgi:hypothetical protein